MRDKDVRTLEQRLCLLDVNHDMPSVAPHLQRSLMYVLRDSRSFVTRTRLGYFEISTPRFCLRLLAREI